MKKKKKEKKGIQNQTLPEKRRKESTKRKGDREKKKGENREKNVYIKT